MRSEVEARGVGGGSGGRSGLKWAETGVGVSIGGGVGVGRGGVGRGGQRRANGVGRGRHRRGGQGWASGGLRIRA